ncbi:MAG: undecaprenyl-diphosphate phosphatase [Candidatus Obscuribacterales bacterium]|nr:undecaprenyl-diphosphate phosphatase [Candidatus Obscuribacterales bacterium]
MLNQVNSMETIQAIVLGVVQGLTEFLPISSTAHLRAVPALLGWADPGVDFTAVIQLGSVLALFAYFRNDIMTLASGSFQALRKGDLESKEARIAGAIIVGTIPVCVIGLALKNILEQNDGPFRSLIVIGTASIVMGILLFAAEKLAKHTRSLDSIGVKDGLIIGLGQALALIPGCSRSGSTLTVAMLSNLKREDAARFSFLLGIPATTLSGLLELKHFIDHGSTETGIASLAIGTIVSAIVSYAAIAWLLKFLINHSTWLFIIYRIVFGAGLIGLSLTNVIH